MCLRDTGKDLMLQMFLSLLFLQWIPPLSSDLKLVVITGNEHGS